MNVYIMPFAMEDLYEGYAFYEMQQRRLGKYFRDSLFTDIDSLQFFGGIHRKRFGYHVMPSKRFPFGIYYSVNNDVIEVYAVLDFRRDPKWMERRLSDL